MYHETSPAVGEKINAFFTSNLQLQVYISRKRKASVMIANQHTLDIQQSHHGSQRAVLRNPFHCIEWIEAPANCETVKIKTKTNACNNLPKVGLVMRCSS